MPKVSVNILTKNRAPLLRRALYSIWGQSYKDIEVILISDGSTDNTEEITQELTKAGLNIDFVIHNESLGITASRQEALLKSKGEFIAILDDDDEWVDVDKLKKQVEFLDQNSDFVLVGGGISVIDSKNQALRTKLRPQTDENIRQTMLLRNNFFTSTVMFKREMVIKVGGFIKDEQDFAEDYDLWLRLGNVGKMFNFQEVFTKYTLPNYNKERFIGFLKKQKSLIIKYKSEYPNYLVAYFILSLRIFFKI
jgi:glycosyltransferase involved in cell wall biosynthesis